MICVHHKLEKQGNQCPVNLRTDLLCPLPLFTFMKEYTPCVQFVFISVFSLSEKDAIKLPLPPTTFFNKLT